MWRFSGRRTPSVLQKGVARFNPHTTFLNGHKKRGQRVKVQQHGTKRCCTGHPALHGHLAPVYVRLILPGSGEFCGCFGGLTDKTSVAVHVKRNVFVVMDRIDLITRKTMNTAPFCLH